MSDSKYVKTMTGAAWRRGAAAVYIREIQKSRQTRRRTDGWAGRLTRAVGPVDYSLSRSVFLSFASFLPSFLAPSEGAAMPLPSILGGGCASVRVCVRVVQSRSGPDRYMRSTVHPMVRRDGKGVPVHTNLK